MVDSISSTSQAQSLSSVNKSQRGADTSRSEMQGTRGISDEVSLSDEAISLAQAEGIARDVSSALSNDESLTLSSDAKRLELL